MRILHVIQPANTRSTPWPVREGAAELGSDAAIMGLVGVIAATPEIEHDVLLLGGPTEAVRARAMGLRSFHRAAPALGLPGLAGPTLRSLLRSVPWFDVIQFWGSHMRRLACRLRRQRALVFDLDSGMVSPVRGGRLRGPMSTAPSGLIAAGDSRNWMAERDAVRHRLELAPGEVATYPIGDPPTSIAAQAMTVLSAILHTLNIQNTLVVPRSSSDLARSLRHVTEGGNVGRIVIVDEPLSLLAPGADLAVINEHWPKVGPSRTDLASRLLMGRFVQSGVPIIGAAGIPGLHRLFDACPQATAPCARPADLSAPALRVIESAEIRTEVLAAQRAAMNDAPGLPEFLQRTWEIAKATMGPVGSV